MCIRDSADTFPRAPPPAGCKSPEARPSPQERMILVYRQRTDPGCGNYGLLRSVPGVSDGSVFYQGPCPAKNAVRGGVCVCGCGCETPLEPCPRYAPCLLYTSRCVEETAV